MDGAADYGRRSDGTSYGTGLHVACKRRLTEERLRSRRPLTEEDPYDEP